jgi:nucleoside-diphosphate-sugar epimerase
MKFSSALVTGATGLIGKKLTQQLVQANTKVICLIRKQSDRALLPKNVDIITIENFSYQNITTALKNISAETVFHLAAYGVPPNQRNPQEMLQANINATIALINATQKWPLKKFIYTSSCAAYGIPLIKKSLPETTPLRSDSIYGASKAAAEIYAASVAQHLQLPFITLRLFGIYGVGEASYRLIPYLINKLQLNQTVDLTPGNQTRDFLYVADAVNAIITAANSPITNGAYNICSSKPITVKEIAIQVARALNKPTSLLKFGARSYRQDETMWLVGDNTKFCKTTGWQPAVSLSQGIQRMLNASQEQIQCHIN